MTVAGIPAGIFMYFTWLLPDRNDLNQGHTEGLIILARAARSINPYLMITSVCSWPFSEAQVTLSSDCFEDMK